MKQIVLLGGIVALVAIGVCAILLVMEQVTRQEFWDYSLKSVLVIAIITIVLAGIGGLTKVGKK